VWVVAEVVTDDFRREFHGSATDSRPSRKPIAGFRNEGQVHGWNVGLVVD
jgi:hypothetical protein